MLNWHFLKQRHKDSDVFVSSPVELSKSSSTVTRKKFQGTRLTSFFNAVERISYSLRSKDYTRHLMDLGREGSRLFSDILSDATRFFTAREIYHRFKFKGTEPFVTAIKSPEKVIKKLSWRRAMSCQMYAGT